MTRPRITFFDLDHTLLPIDSDYEWGEFTQAIGWTDPVEFKRRNDAYFQHYLAGTLNVAGSLGTLRVAGGTPGTISAGSIGTIGVHGGYGPVIAQIRENGIQRRLDADLPDNPYPNPDPTALPSPSGASYVNFQFFYEGTGTGRILQLELDPTRTRVAAAGTFADGLAGGVTDLELGPDGRVYALTASHLYRLDPAGLPPAPLSPAIPADTANPAP